MRNNANPRPPQIAAARNRTGQSHENWTVRILDHFTLRRSSILDLLLRPQRRWPAGDRGGTVLLGRKASGSDGASSHFYFFLPDAWFGCHAAAVPVAPDPNPP